MQETFETFYKKYGINNPSQILNRIFTIDKFHFPKNVLLHYVTHDIDDIGPDENLVFFKELKTTIPTDHLSELSSNLGRPIKTNVNSKSLIHNFHQKHKLFKYYREPFKTIKNSNLLEVMNYGFLQKLYKYTDNPFSEYYNWINIEKSFWDEIKLICNSSDRQNFRFINLPDMLPGITILNNFSDEVNTTMLKKLDSPEKLFILDIWKWLSEKNRENSLLKDFNQTELGKINIVFFYKNNWSLINLGYLNSWRKNDDNKDNLHELHSEALQKVFLRHLLSVHQNSINSLVLNVSEPRDEVYNDSYKPLDDKGIEEDTESTELDNTEPTTIINDDTNTDNKYTIDKTIVDQNTKEVTLIDKDIDDKKEDVPEFLSNINDDLSVLDEAELFLTNKNDIEKHTESINKTTILKAINTEYNSEDYLESDLEKISEFNTISISEYKSKLKLLDNVDKYDNPYNKNIGIKDYSNIKPEDIEIKDSDISIPDSDTVFDKSMLKSSHLELDKKYIKDILPRDIVRTVSSIQKAGIFIQNHNVEKVSDIQGDYEIHSITVQPVDGINSIIKFKIPTVDEDGVFTSRNVKYKMRKQRVDIPIRKINSFTVGLTSYYGKIFVTKSEKKKHDSDNWLYNYIIQSSYNKENDIILKANPSNVFDNYFIAPKTYTGLAKYFRSIVLRDMTLILNHKDGLNLFDIELIDKLENNSTINNREYKCRLIGKTNNNEPVVVGFDNKFYVYKNVVTESSNNDVYQESGSSTFTHNDNNYDVNKILRLSKDLPIKKFNVNDLKWIIDNTEVDEENNLKRIEKADLTTPILVSYINNKPTILDGIHRLKKAIQNGNNEIIGKEVPIDILEQSKIETPITTDIKALHEIGDIYHILNVNISKVPVNFTALKVFSKTIPLAIVLGYMLGFDNLLILLDCKYEIKDSSDRFKIASDEYSIKFKDKTYIFSRRDTIATQILHGFNEYKDVIKKYVVESFNENNVYFNVLMSDNINIRYLKEINLLDRLFIDPITRDILLSFNEPITFKGLLLKANEMLVLDTHPDSQDPDYMRFRGYERISGAIYRNMIYSIRDFNNRNIKGKSKVELHPFIVWNTIMDPSVKLVEDINPIQDLKQKETVTYVGEGGRNKESVNKATRTYHENDMGVISEATVDSGDVGINAYTSANPKLGNLYGIKSSFDLDIDGPTSLLSTSALLSPGAINDDPVRV